MFLLERTWKTKITDKLPNMQQKILQTVWEFQISRFAFSLLVKAKVSLKDEENVSQLFNVMFEEVYGRELNYVPSGPTIQKMSPRGYVPPPSRINRALHPDSKEYQKKFSKRKCC